MNTNPRAALLHVLTISLVTAIPSATFADVTLELTKQYLPPTGTTDSTDLLSSGDPAMEFSSGKIMKESLYLKGQYERHDFGDETKIVDHAKDKVIIIDWNRREYAIMSEEDEANLQPGFLDPSTVADLTPKLVPGTSKIADHRVLHYRVSYKVSEGSIFGRKNPQKKTQITDVWTAPDLPASNPLAHADLYGLVQLDRYHHVPGMILSVSISEPSGPSIEIKANKVSTQPIPDSEFQLPAGFTHVSSL